MLREHVQDFLNFVFDPPEENKLKILEKHLVKLYFIATNLPTDIAQSNEAIDVDYDNIRERLNPKFPEFGYYYDVGEITKLEEDAQVLVGDAMDDITEIVIDLQRSVAMESDEDFTSYMQSMFEFHTKFHIVNLIYYLDRIHRMD